MRDRKPRWAWSSVDDPSPYYPKCGRCEAFARWSICNLEDTGMNPATDPLTPVVRWFACGVHMNKVLMEANWNLDAVQVYDLTQEPERS